VTCNGHQFTELKVVIAPSPGGIRKMSVGLIDFRELLLSNWISVVLGMIFQGQVSISLLNFIEGSILWDTKDFIVSALAVGVLLFEEFLLAFMEETVFVVKLLESSISIVGAVFVDEVVIVISSSRARKHIVGLADVVELALGMNSVTWVLFGMPLSRKFLIGVINLCLGGLVGETKSSVVILILVG
jgi:hypothetical protein